MSIIRQYRCASKNLGLLAVLYPDVPVLSGPFFPPFIAAERVIVVSDDKAFTRYRDKQVIQITRWATDGLDTRKGFLRALRERGVKAYNSEVNFLLFEASDEEFWYHAKIAVVTKRFTSIPKILHSKDPQSTVLDIFKHLFADFGEVFRRYEVVRRTRDPEAVLEVLLEMMRKAQNPRAQFAARPYYRRLLEHNHRFVPLWLIALTQEIISPLPSFFQLSRDRQEWRLLSLFAACSAHARHDVDPWFKEKSGVASELRLNGFDPRQPAVQRLFPGALFS